jgi:multidrug efflux pump subunit AcrA (membrane-fusion protein)
MDQLRKLGEWIIRRKYLSLVILTLLIAGTVAARNFLQSSRGQLSPPLQRGVIVDAVYGIGTVTANRRYSLNPLIGKTIGRSYVKEGDHVKRTRPLVATDDGNIFYAPFDGVVNFFPYHPGENTYPTTPMLIFTDMSDRYVVVSIEQQSALHVRVGQTAKLSFDSLRQASFEGRVAAVYSYASNFLARIDSVRLPDSVLPDMTCDVAIVLDVHKDALIIPVAAFESGRVWVKRGKALPRATPVKLGVIDGTNAEIVEGDVKPGDQVLIRDQVSP